jgi:hypothetical protein
LHRIAWLACALLAPGCARRPAEAGASPSAVVAGAFGPQFFDAEKRRAAFEGDAAERLILPGLVDAGRYEFLQVAELRRTGDGARAGAMAFAIDHWPMALGVELRRGEAGWRITAVDSPERQRALLDLLGPDGLPRAPSAHPWAGGLAGRDEVGRPTAAVLVLAFGSTVAVDGQDVTPADERAVTAAIGEAIAVRQRLARDAHATYRPQVALALPAAAPAARPAELAEQARRAGAEEAFLVVRGPDGRPALLTLARRTTAPSPSLLARVARARLEASGASIELDGRTAAVPFVAGRVDPGPVGEALRKLAGESPPAGVVITADPTGTYGQTVALLDACHAAFPALPLLAEAPR